MPSPLQLPAHGSLSSFLSLRAPLFCVEVNFSSPCLIAFLPLCAEPREQGGIGEHVTNVVTASEEQQKAPESGLSAFSVTFLLYLALSPFCCFFPLSHPFPLFARCSEQISSLLLSRSQAELLQEQTHRGLLCSMLPACTAPPPSLTPGITLLETLLLLS